MLCGEGGFSFLEDISIAVNQGTLNCENYDATFTLIKKKRMKVGNNLIEKFDARFLRL